MNDEDNETIQTLPNSWREIQPDTVYQTRDGRQVSFSRRMIKSAKRFDQNGKHLHAIEVGNVPPEGTQGLVPSEEPGYAVKTKVLGVGGDRRYHGFFQNGVLNFTGRDTAH